MKSDRCFCLKCIKLCSVFISSSVAPSRKVTGRHRLTPSENCPWTLFCLELCHHKLVVVNSLLKTMCILFIFFLIVYSTLVGFWEQALLPPSSVCGSEGSVSHQGAAVSFSYLSRLQIILEYAWEKVKKEGESPGTAAGKLVILI